MIRFSALYPVTEGASFDYDYFVGTHVPLALKAWGLGSAQVDKGVNGPYVAAAHFEFESQEALGAALGAEGTAEVTADMANYTTIQPVTQISEIIG